MGLQSLSTFFSYHPIGGANPLTKNTMQQALVRKCLYFLVYSNLHTNKLIHRSIVQTSPKFHKLATSNHI